jgi:hypothetical protein
MSQVPPLSSSSTTPLSSSTPIGGGPLLNASSNGPRKDSLSTRRGNVWKTLQTALSKMWKWVKLNFLFCIFDVEEEKLNKLRSEFVKFRENYHKLAGGEDADAPGKVKAKFDELSPVLKQRIKRRITEILKKIQPNREAEYYSSMQDQLLNDPFLTVEKVTNSREGENKRVIVFAKAITDVEFKLSEPRS